MIIDTPTRLRVLILAANADDAVLLVRELQRASFDPDGKLVASDVDHHADL